MRRHWKLVLGLVGAIVVVFVGIQFVPYRVTNPPVRQEPAWNSPRTRQLAVAACFDCHSNQTHTESWEDIAPLSWWITNHVKEGREKLNFSEWGSGRSGVRRRGRDRPQRLDASGLLHLVRDALEREAHRRGEA